MFKYVFRFRSYRSLNILIFKLRLQFKSKTSLTFWFWKLVYISIGKLHLASNVSFFIKLQLQSYGFSFTFQYLFLIMMPKFLSTSTLRIYSMSNLNIIFDSEFKVAFTIRRWRSCTNQNCKITLKFLLYSELEVLIEKILFTSDVKSLVVSYLKVAFQTWCQVRFLIPSVKFLSNFGLYVPFQCRFKRVFCIRIWKRC